MRTQQTIITAGLAIGVLAAVAALFTPNALYAETSARPVVTVG
jgi:hypothetical protein